MNKLSKEKQTLLEHALDNLYAFLKNMYKVDYSGNIFCMVYEDIVHLNQSSCQDDVAWFADIVLKERRIHISVREVEHDSIYSKFDYDLFYMGSKPKIHTIWF